MRNPLSIFFLALMIGSVGVTPMLHGQVSESEIGALAKDAASGKAAAQTPAIKQSTGIDFLSLLVRGGVFMIPIGLVSLMAVTFVIDRWIGLRTGRLLPSGFRKSLMAMIRAGDLADPRDMYRLCNSSNSVAASIASMAVSRTGRPHAEIAAEVADATQRQADRAYANVRWLNLAAGVAPLLGLLGTVWGLIRAFHDTTQLTAGQNRADFLAVGIYEALVTTLAGLSVAIPAAIASHYFEGRITRMFGQIEELMSELVRSLERFEGKTRFDVIGRELSPRDIGHNIAPPPIASGTMNPSELVRAKASR